MREFLLNIQTNFQKYWQKLSGAQKATVVILAILILASLVAVTFWATRPQYSVLFSNLTAQDASAVVNKLKEMKVPYELTRRGNTIMVPSDKVYDLRISLAGQGIPQGGGVGFEIFDKSFFGMTEFTQKLNFQRALQGELERTIRQIAGVEGVRVHLVIPKEELFVEEKKEPSASILLKLAPGTKLSKQQIRAIANLVKTSVEGLKEENISIIDTRGEILSDVLEDEFASVGTVADMFQVKKKIEHDLQNEIRSLLEKIVGIGKVAVKANVELNLTREETTKEEYTPVVDKKGIVRSEQRKVEFFKGSGGSTGGVPGVESNTSSVPGYVSPAGGGSSSDYTKEDTVTNYEINKKLSHLLSMPGEIKRISISVLLDGDFPQDVLDTIKQLVASGIGIDEGRGDEVVVESFKFDKSYLKEEEKEAKMRQKIEFRNMLIKAGVIVFISLIVFLFTLSMIRHYTLIRTATKKIQEKQKKIEVPEVPTPVAEQVTPGPPRFEEADIDNMRRQVEEVAHKEPEKIARVIKGLLTGS